MTNKKHFMKNQLTDEQIWEMIGFVKISPSRYNTLITLKTDYLMPSEIARLTGMRTTQVSNALSDLKKKNLVECMNESAHKGRLYQNTPLGLEILAILEKKD